MWSYAQASSWNALAYYFADAIQNNLFWNRGMLEGLSGVISRNPLHASIIPTLQSLHWLKIEQRIQHKVISINYDVLNNFEATYPRHLITPCSRSSTRSDDCL